MSRMAPSHFGPLSASATKALHRTLAAEADITVFVDGTVHRLDPDSTSAVVELLRRLARGEAVILSGTEEFLTTAQAAELAGISHTFVRNMTDRGDWPVEYRGSHRRIPRHVVTEWLQAQAAAKKNSITEHDGGPAEP